MNRYNNISKKEIKNISNISKLASDTILSVMNLDVFMDSEVDKIKRNIEYEISEVMNLLLTHLPSLAIMSDINNTSIRLLVENNTITQEIKIDNNIVNLDELLSFHFPDDNELYLEIIGRIYFNFISAGQSITVLRIDINLKDSNSCILTNSSVLLNISDIIEKSEIKEIATLITSISLSTTK